MTYDPQKAIRQALMVARRHAAYGGGYEGYSSYGPMGYRKGLPAFVTQEELDQSGGDVGAGMGGPAGAPGTGNIGEDAASFAEAAGPAVAGAAVGAAMGGIPGAIAGMAVGNMAQGLAQNVGLSAPANAPVSGPLGVVGNIAQTAMSVAPDPADTEDADQGAAQNAAAAAAAAAAQAAADAEAADNANSNANAATADAAGPGEGNGDNGGDGNGGSGDGNGFAQGGDVGDAEDHSSHHEYEARCFANGGEIDSPENTVKAYKLFKTKKNSPGKLFPLFVNADKPVPVGKWIAAEEGPIEDGKVKSSLGKLAYRPGWHAGDLPVATHIGRKSQKGLTKPDYRPDNHVWAEVEMPADVDWQSVADQRADRDKSGKIIPKTAHITDQIPHGGFYRYKTNPNMTGNWLISGGMKVNRVLSDDEVKQINDQAGVADLPRLQDLKASDRYADGGQITPPRDLDADPAVQQALDITRQAQPTAPQIARQLNEQGMYSHAAEVAAGLPQAKGSPQQMMAMLSSRGVKPDEIKHSGVEDAFGNQKVVTKDQLAQHFNENMPQIEKVVLGGKQPFDERRLAQLEKEYSALDEHPIDAPSFGEDKYNEMIRLMNIRDQSSTQSLYDAAERAMQQAQRAQSRGDRNTAERYFREHELLNTRAEKLDLEGQGLSRPTKYKSFTLPGGENYREVLFKAKERNADQLEAAQNKRYELRLLYDDAMENYKKISESNPGHPNAVAAYQKVNETRSALKNAEKELSNLQSEAASRTYESSHWDEPNVLAHVRLLDRKAPNGEKVLHVEEIQSDWAQEGRREGFKDVDALKKYQKKNLELMAQFQEAHKAHKELTDRLAPPVNERFRPGEESPRGYEDRINALEEERQKSLAEHPEWKASAKRLQDIRNAHKALGEQMPSDTGVPAGPYVTNTQAWTDLALKAALKEAVEGNYDRIAWTGGQDQAERYDLSKHIDSVHYNPGTQTLYAMNKNGREVLNEDTEPHEIQKHIGKELADKLLADVPDLHSVINEHEIEKDPETGKWGIFLYGDPIHDYGGDPLEFDSKSDAKDHLREMAQESLNNHTSTLRNVDLVVGGEGMKSYYDKIVPTRIMEVTKKLGVPTKVEPHKIDTEEGEKTLHSIKVTPELKAAVMRGMPVYKAGGAVSYSNGGMAFDNPIIQEALRIAAKKRPMVALADLFQRQLRGRPPS